MLELSYEDIARHEKPLHGRLPLELDNEPLKLTFDKEIFKEHVSSPVNEESVRRAKMYMEEIYEYREAIAEGALEVINKANQQDIETMFFLDRSARPFGFFVLRLYQEIYPGEPHPDVKFINIGREDNGKYDDPIAIAQAKYLFENAVDNKKVLLVDDVTDTGTTRDRAMEFFQNNFNAASLGFTTIYPNIDYFSSRNQLMHVNKTITGVKDGPGLISEVSKFDEPYENVFDLENIALLPEGTTSTDLKRTEFLAMRDELSRLAIEVARHLKNTSPTAETHHIEQVAEQQDPLRSAFEATYKGKLIKKKDIDKNEHVDVCGSIVLTRLDVDPITDIPAELKTEHQIPENASAMAIHFMPLGKKKRIKNDRMLALATMHMALYDLKELIDTAEKDEDFPDVIVGVTNKQMMQAACGIGFWEVPYQDTNSLQYMVADTVRNKLGDQNPITQRIWSSGYRICITKQELLASRPNIQEKLEQTQRLGDKLLSKTTEFGKKDFDITFIRELALEELKK